jgi:tetratricopeptide (TPR) repeat protein
MRQLPVACLAAMTAALVIGLESGAIAQGDGGWVGRRVITKYGTVLMVGNAVVDDEKRSTDLAVSGHDRRTSRVYRVEQVNGPWLWLAAEKEGVAGWVKIEQVVPFEQAVDYYTSEIRTNPSSSAYNNRGLAWHDKKEYDIAIADFNEAIRLDPRYATAYMNRGRAWYAKKEYDRAIADYGEAIRLDPKFAVAYSGRGRAWSAKKEYDRAIADYGEAIRLDPKDALAYTNRGSAWSAKKEYDRAIADYGEAIRLDPKFAMAYYNRGLAWSAKKEYDRAIADYDEAIRLDPKDASAYTNRGSAWSAKKEYDRAIADYGEAIRLDPKLGGAYTSRAMTLLVASREIALGDVRGWLDAAGWRDEQAPYIVLLSHFALRRAHHDGDARRLLDEAASKIDTTAWPYPVVRYLRKEIDGKALLAAATDHDKMTEAQTYLGLDLILSDRAKDALPGLEWVRDHGNKAFFEHDIAVAELDRIEATNAARP